MHFKIIIIIIMLCETYSIDFQNKICTNIINQYCNFSAVCEHFVRIMFIAEVNVVFDEGLCVCIYIVIVR